MRVISGVATDIRVSVRRLAGARGFTLLAVVTLAVGVGAVSTAFSLAHALWLKPLPFLEPDRLVWIHARHQPSGTSASLTAVELAEHRRDLRAFTGVAGFSYGAGIARVNDEPLRIAAHRVTPDLFRVLGVRPAIGRDFADADASVPVVMLSDATWTARFGRDPAILQRTLTLDGVSYAIAGVMPPGFSFPRGLEADAWMPVDLAAGGDAVARAYQAVARLAPGFEPADAATEAATRAERLARAFPEIGPDWTALVTPAGVTASPATRLGFQVLLAIVGLFLLIACTNLAGLLLARHASRRAELAVCLSIGASRWRLARMILVESLIVASLGGAAGVLLAAYGARAVAAVMPPRLPGLDDVRLNLTVVAVAVAASVAAAIVVSVLPALGLRALRPAEALAGARTSARGSTRAERALVVAEIALAVMLVVGAAAMLRSLTRLLDRDRGYDPRDLHALNVSLPFSDDSYLPIDRRARAFDAILERVAAVPGVRQVAATTGFPGSALGILGSTPVALDGRAPLIAALHSASPEYFATMGIPVVAGRAFRPADTTAAPGVAVVNELLAREFPAGQAVGRRIPVTIYGRTQSIEIVGVAGNIRLGERIGHRVFVPLAQASPYWIDLVLRADAGTAVLPAVRRALRAHNGDLLIENATSFQSIISNSLALERAESALAAVVGALSAALAGIGVYSLMTFVGARRRRELGIRLALGSPPRRLFRDAVAGALRLVVAGLAIGLVMAAALVRLAGNQVFGLTTADTAAYTAAAALVLAVSLAAVWVPARRLMRIDPLIALRPE
jgi:predicted permease